MRSHHPKISTRMVTVDPAAMANGLATSGRIALYGIYFDTDKTDVKPESAPTLCRLCCHGPNVSARRRYQAAEASRGGPAGPCGTER